MIVWYLSRFSCLQKNSWHFRLMLCTWIVVRHSIVRTFFNDEWQNFVQTPLMLFFNYSLAVLRVSLLPWQISFLAFTRSKIIDLRPLVLPASPRFVLVSLWWLMWVLFTCTLPNDHGNWSHIYISLISDWIVTIFHLPFHRLLIREACISSNYLTTTVEVESFWLSASSNPLWLVTYTVRGDRGWWNL